MTPRTKHVVAITVVLVAVLAATAHRFRNGLVWDDYFSIATGTVVHDIGEAGNVFRHPTLYVTTVYQDSDRRRVETYRPITLLTFMIDSLVSGRDPAAYHATNLAGHLACTLLVFFLARMVLPERRRKYAAFAAAWFGLSPLLAEAHVWINGRSDVFCTLFGLGALLAWRAGCRDAPRRRRVLFLLLSGLLFLLATLSKEVALLLWPAILAWPRNTEESDVALGPAPGRWRAHVASLFPFALASAVYFAMRVNAIHGVRAAGDSQQLLTAITRAPVLILDGLSQTLVPTRVYIHSMVDDYGDFGPAALAGFAALLGALFLVLIWGRFRSPLLVWSLVWFAGTLAPAAVIATELWPGFGRYLYLPVAGLVIGSTDALARIVEWRPRSARILHVAALVYLLALGGRLFAFTLDFESDDALWGAVIRQEPYAHHGYGWLGLMRNDHGRYTEAVAPLRRASELAPQELRYLDVLASATYNLGECDQTVEIAETGASRFSPYAGAFHMFAVNCLNGTDPERTMRHLLQCIGDDPGRPDCAAALAHATTSHPLAPQYRAIMLELLQTEEFARVSRFIAPLPDEG